MNALEQLTDQQLHLSAVNAAKREREETLNVLKHLAEIDRRRLYAKFACDSLFAYFTKKLLMSEGQAGRHVASARLMSELPVVEESLLDGSMSFTNLAQASMFFRKEKQSGSPLASAEKLAVIESLKSKSTREVSEILLETASTPSVHLRETMKPKTSELTEVVAHLDRDTIEMFERLKELWSHESPNAKFGEIAKRAFDAALEKYDPIRKAEKAKTRSALATAQFRNEARVGGERGVQRGELHPQGDLKFESNHARRRYIPAAVKLKVRLRDFHRCTFTDPETGELCGSRHYLEFDHIIPFANGGENTADNLRLRCRTHNLLHAAEVFGDSTMRGYKSKTFSRAE